MFTEACFTDSVSDEYSCCFSGHREIPTAHLLPLQQMLERRVAELAEAGYKQFICGGALGFDTMAAEAVLKYKNNNGGISLRLAIPFPEHGNKWSSMNRFRYEAILKEADEVIYTSTRYHTYCMQTRNRYMVDHSSHLICYLSESGGGTAYTVSYAIKKNLTIENLALNL